MPKEQRLFVGVDGISILSSDNSTEQELTRFLPENKMACGLEAAISRQILDAFSSGRRSSVVEQLIRNQQVGGSIPLAGSIFKGFMTM